MNLKTCLLYRMAVIVIIVIEEFECNTCFFGGRKIFVAYNDCFMVMLCYDSGGQRSWNIIYKRIICLYCDGINRNCSQTQELNHQCYGLLCVNELCQWSFYVRNNLLNHLMAWWTLPLLFFAIVLAIIQSTDHETTLQLGTVFPH